MSADLWEGFNDSLDPETITGPVWDEPVPLNPRRELPTFPVHALPDWLSGMVAGVAEETQTPVDLAGCLALAVLATAAGGRATVHVRGHWREPVNLYTAVALPPGNRKSAVFALMTGPLLAAEKALVELSGPRRAEAETTARLARSAADKAAQKAAAAEPGLRDQLTAEAVHLAQQADEMTVPAKPQLVADDVTPESLATLVADQEGRMSVMSAEGEIFDIIAGRYSGTPNMGIFLKGHAGDMVRVNRQGRDAQHVEAPAITMGLAIQPEVLDSLGRVKGADGRGLLARFLYAKPVSLVGSRNLTPDLLPEETAAAYAKQLGGLALALADWTDPAVLTLTPEADAVLLAYQKVTESRIGKGRSLHPVIKWASKRDGAVARIAGLLHLATHPDNGKWSPHRGRHHGQRGGDRGLLHRPRPGSLRSPARGTASMSPPASTACTLSGTSMRRYCWTLARASRRSASTLATPTRHSRCGCMPTSCRRVRNAPATPSTGCSCPPLTGLTAQRRPSSTRTAPIEH
ncbi:hypothetical protein SCALM49S_09416 [Streptomyces californicus]